MCFLSFKTVVTSRNILAFKIKNFPAKKNGLPSRFTLFSTSCRKLVETNESRDHDVQVVVEMALVAVPVVAVGVVAVELRKVY